MNLAAMYEAFGFDLSAVIGFLVATMLAIWPGNLIVGSLFHAAYGPKEQPPAPRGSVPASSAVLPASRAMVPAATTTAIATGVPQAAASTATREVSSNVDHSSPDEEPQLFDMSAAVRIGRIERILYVYSVMTTAFGVLSGWLVMKAFFAWLDRADPKPGNYYHRYLYGNALSLLCGLVAGHFGKAVAAILRSILGG